MKNIFSLDSISISNIDSIRTSDKLMTIETANGRAFELHFKKMAHLVRAQTFLTATTLQRGVTTITTRSISYMNHKHEVENMEDIIIHSITTLKPIT